MNVDIAQIITQGLGFFMLVWLMRKFAWGPILTVLDDRREKIISDFADIERTKQEIASLKSEYEQKLERIEEQADEEVHKAVQKAEGISKKIIEDARSEGAKILEKTRENVRLEMKKAQSKMRDEVVTLSLLVASKILKSELDRDKHNTLISRTIGNVKEF